jgi:mannitol/fructose-specific phosphotransferase system IIA component (Ntr-type)
LQRNIVLDTSSFGRNRDIVKDLVRNARGVTIIVLDTREEGPPATVPLVEAPEGMASVKTAPETMPQIVAGGMAHTVVESRAQTRDQLTLSRLLSPQRIVIWDQAVQREVVLRTLVERIWKDVGAGDVETLFSDVLKREEQGSTFLNEGVAFPHVRVRDLHTPIVALGLTRQGISDVATEKPIEVVFLILSPTKTPGTQVQVLGLSSRAAQSRHLLQSLRSARTQVEAVNMIRDWEVANE